MLLGNAAQREAQIAAAQAKLCHRRFDRNGIDLAEQRADQFVQPKLEPACFAEAVRKA